MITAAYCSYAVLSLLAFRRFGGARAAVFSIIFGWALLPVMDYISFLARDSLEAFGVRGIALLQPMFINRGTVIGATVLAGVLLFDRPALARLRWRWFDLPISLWCLLPLLAGLRNGLPLPEIAGNVVYFGLVWGVPYFAGRLYLSRPDGARWAVVGFVVAGIAYVPLCLLEIVSKPWLYTCCYGFHPHQLEGASRWIGWRPVVFLEHGNQLGIWMAIIAVFAWWMNRSSAYRHGKSACTRLVAWLLPLVVLACQSVGPALLMLASMFSLVFLRRIRGGILLSVVLLPIALYAGLRLTGAFKAEATLIRMVGPHAVQKLKGSFRWKSLAWRVTREEEHLPRIQERLLVGHGSAHWWDRRHASPWGFWTHAVGAFGVLGLVTFFSALVLPIALFLRRYRPVEWDQPPVAPYALLALALILTLIDGMLNTTLNLPFLIAAGALSGSGDASLSDSPPTGPSTGP